MKNIRLALAFCLLANVCSAQGSDASERARVLKLQEEFKTGIIPHCALLEFKDGSLWLVLGQNPPAQSAELFLVKGDGETFKNLDFDNLQVVAEIKEVNSRKCGEGGACCVTD